MISVVCVSSSQVLEGLVVLGTECPALACRVAAPARGLSQWVHQLDVYFQLCHESCCWENAVLPGRQLGGGCHISAYRSACGWGMGMDWHVM